MSKGKVSKKLNKARVSTTTIQKLACGLVLVALAFNGAFRFLDELAKENVSDSAIKVIAAVIIAVLALKLAQCDTVDKGVNTK